jgi:hypothetical protein
LVGLGLDSNSYQPEAIRKIEAIVFFFFSFFDIQVFGLGQLARNT